MLLLVWLLLLEHPEGCGESEGRDGSSEVGWDPKFDDGCRRAPDGWIGFGFNAAAPMAAAAAAAAPGRAAT